MCTLNDGTYIIDQVFWHDVTLNLYNACSKSASILKFFGTAIQIPLPSGMVIELVDEDGNIPNFVVEPQKYWAVKITFDGFEGLEDIMGFQPTLRLPLPKMLIGDIFKALLYKFDFPVQGSTNWKYKDYDGVIRKGSDCTPPRDYRIISDGIFDNKYTILILTIILILKKLGLLKVASDFLKEMVKNYQARQLRSNVTKVLQGIHNLSELPTDMDELDIALDTLEAHVKGIKSQIGVKLL